MTRNKRARKQQPVLLNDRFLDRVASKLPADLKEGIKQLDSHIKEQKQAAEAERASKQACTRKAKTMTKLAGRTVYMLLIALATAVMSSVAAGVIETRHVPAVSVIVGPHDVPGNLTALQQSDEWRTINISSWMCCWGHYPVNTVHLMGHPEFTGKEHVSQAYARPVDFDGWAGVSKEGLCFTGWVYASLLQRESMAFLNCIPFTDVLKRAGHPNAIQPVPGKVKSSATIRRHTAGIANASDEQEAFKQFEAVVEAGWNCHVVFSKTSAASLVKQAKKGNLTANTVEVAIADDVNLKVSVLSGLCSAYNTKCDVALILHGQHLCTIKHWTAVEAIVAVLTAMRSWWRTWN